MAPARSSERRAPRQFPLELPKDLHLDLEVFCDRHFKAPKTEVVRRALQQFLDEQERADSEFARLLKQDRQERLSDASAPREVPLLE